MTAVAVLVVIVAAVTTAVLILNVSPANRSVRGLSAVMMAVETSAAIATRRSLVLSLASVSPLAVSLTVRANNVATTAVVGPAASVRAEVCVRKANAWAVRLSQRTQARALMGTKETEIGRIHVLRAWSKNMANVSCLNQVQAIFPLRLLGVARTKRSQDFFTDSSF